LKFNKFYQDIFLYISFKKGNFDHQLKNQGLSKTYGYRAKSKLFDWPHKNSLSTLKCIYTLFPLYIFIYNLFFRKLNGWLCKPRSTSSVHDTQSLVHFLGCWMMIGREQWAGRASCVGVGFSWKCCTASGGKSAFPLAGAPLIIIVFGGLQQFQFFFMWFENTTARLLFEIFFVFSIIDIMEYR